MPLFLPPVNEVSGKVILQFHKCLSVQRGGLCPGGSLSKVGLCPGGSLGGGSLSGGGLCPGEGVSVQGGLSGGGLCPGGSLSRGGDLCPAGSLSSWTPPCRVKSGRCASYWNAFLLKKISLLEVYASCKKILLTVLDALQKCLQK